MTAARGVRGAVAADLGGRWLVAACDALGGIGPKPRDAVTAPAEVVGRFTARVALMELMALGAEPLMLVGTQGVEPEPTGSAIMAGIREEAAVVGLGPRAIAGSFERNVPVAQTSAGVTAVGLAGALRVGGGRAGDAVVALGRPRVGRAVRLGDGEIADLPALVRVLACPAAAAVAPAGSGGIADRAAALAAECGLGWTPGASPAVDLHASAGPATVLVCVTADAEAVGSAFGGPWSIVGRLRAC